MQRKFLTLIEKHNEDLKKNNKIYNILGYIKLLLVILTGILLYFNFLKDFPLEFTLPFAGAFILLSILWVYHNKIREKLNYAKGIIRINECHIDRITGKWNSFEDTGEEFVDPGHQYASDLDIVGKKSIFQFLNTTNTWHGRRTFANDLLSPSYGKNELEKRQEAIAELSRDIDFACDIQYHLSQIGTAPKTADFVNELKDKTPFVKSKFVRILLKYGPVLTLIFIAAIIALKQQNLYLAGAMLVMVQAGLWIGCMPKTHNYLSGASGLPYKLSAYNEVIEILIRKDFSSEKLKQIKTQLNTASQGVRDLGKIANRINLKHNGILYFAANVLLLWDCQCSFFLEKWKAKYSHSAEGWFLTLGEFESLLCFSHLANVCDNTCLPVITEKNNVIEAGRMGHPLLTNEARVNNELQFNNSIFIISGSNMSGKTTFLRTVGINLVLARSGSFVCAEKMTCSLFNIITSMRIADNLNEGISTFYAELKRIKSIIEFAEEEKQILFLIDEIFKGTNSADRLAGAKTVISRLDALRAAGMVSTHDLELCELSDSYGRIKNYSFSEQYKDSTICFDYKMKQGKSKTTNAKYLMEMVGIT